MVHESQSPVGYLLKIQILESLSRPSVRILDGNPSICIFIKGPRGILMKTRITQTTNYNKTCMKTILNVIIWIHSFYSISFFKFCFIFLNTDLK